MAEPQVPVKAAEPSKEAVEPEVDDEDSDNPTYMVYVQLPHGDKIELPMGATDTMMEVRQFLSDAPQSCWITSYTLHYNGQELSEAAELASLGVALASKPVLMMKELPYHEHSARMHVRRLRELLEGLVMPDKSPTVFPLLDMTEENVTEEEKNVMIAEFEKPVVASLSKFYPTAKGERVQPASLIKSIAFSGWNPVPGNRRLQGDLFYLEVLTVESKQLVITASVSGFFVNQSNRNVFNPAAEKTPKKSHNLVDLLRAVSPAFTKGFAALLHHEFTAAHPFEMLPVPLPINPWALRSKKPAYELARLDDSCLAIEPPGFVRDWNEEFQSYLEQPKATMQDRIMRDRSLIKVVSEFLDAATRGAVAIVHKVVPPLNPGEPEKTHMWMYSNIFFSSATDVRDQYTNWGGEATAHKAVKIDLNSASRLFQLTTSELRPVLTAVIDYRGHRLTAQAIIPGIMQSSQTERVVYGSPDPGKPINVDAAFRDVLLPVSKELHLAERVIKDPATGNNVTLHTTSDSKGVLGADGRRYFLDLSRLMPRDSNFKSDPRRLMAVHRFELLAQLDLFFTKLCDEEVAKKAPPSLALTDVEKRVIERIRAANPKLFEYIKEQRALVTRLQTMQLESAKTPPNELSAEVKAEFNQLRDKLQAMPAAPRLEFGFNSDLWGPAEVILSPEERAQQEDLLEAAGYFVKERLVPEMISDWSSGHGNPPVDGQHLTTLMHRSGVPVRYLGQLATIAKKSMPYITTLATCEMIARAAKHLFNATLKSITDESLLALTVSHFLNALLGNRQHEEKKKKGANDAAKAAASAPASAAALPARMIVPALTTPALWEAIAQVVKEDYNYVIVPADERASIPRLTFLRSVCLKVGLQVAARDYDFAAEYPFSPTDVFDLFPVTRTLQPRSADGSGLLEEGRAALNGGHLDYGFHQLTEALAVFHQVYGPMHTDTAACYSLLGSLLLHAGDNAQAGVHQRKAVIIYERVAGLDHFDTVTAYHQLAQFVNTSSQVYQGLRFMHRAMSLSALVSGAKHPEHVQHITQAGLMLHECQAPALALRYLQEALRLTEEASPGGPMSEHTAAVCHMLAFIYGANGDFKEALAHEKRTYMIYKAKSGEADQRTQDAFTWMKQFTAQAVQTRRESNKQAEEFVAAAWQDPRVRRYVQNQLGTSLGTGRPSPAEVSRILSKLGNTSPEALARLIQRGASALGAEPAAAAAKGAPGASVPRSRVQSKRVRK